MPSVDLPFGSQLPLTQGRPVAACEALALWGRGALPTSVSSQHTVSSQGHELQGEGGWPSCSSGRQLSTLRILAHPWGPGPFPCSHRPCAKEATFLKLSFQVETLCEAPHIRLECEGGLKNGGEEDKIWERKDTFPNVRVG